MALTAKKAVRAVVVERVLSILGETVVTGAMIYTIAVYNPLYCFAVGWVLELLFCLCVLALQIHTHKRGDDITSITEFKEALHTPVEKRDGPWPGKVWRSFLRGLQAILKAVGIESYLVMIFIWSVVYIEPDYVTIMQREKGETVWSVVDRVMLPAVTWSIMFWTFILYWVAEGARWAIAIFELPL